MISKTTLHDMASRGERIKISTRIQGENAMRHAFGLNGIGALSTTPEVTLSAWRIIRLEDGGVHFAGFNEARQNPTVSSRVKEFNPHTLLGKTESGRRYRLIGMETPTCAAMTERVSKGIFGWLGSTSYTNITSMLLDVPKLGATPTSE